MNKKSILILGICTYSFLLGAAVFFYKERTVFLDIAYHLFNILKDQNFAIQNNRFGAMFTQVFPLLAAKSGLSLNAIALLYSTSFILLYAATFFSILLIQKNTRIALAYFIFGFIITAHTFYWAQSELPQASAFLFLYLGLLDNALTKGVSAKYWILAIPLLITVCFTHPLMIFAVSFSFAFFFLNKKENRKTIAYSFGIYLIITVAKTIFFKTIYDKQSLGGLKNIVRLFPDYIGIKSNENLVKYLVNDYYLVPVAFVMILIFYLKQKEFLKAILITAACFGYIFIVNISYPYNTEQFYIENLYLILGLFIGLPLAVDVLPAIKRKQFAFGVLAIGVLVAMIRICKTHKMYTARLNWNRDLLRSTKNLPHKKLIVRTDNIPEDILIKTWGSCYEFWLLSTLEENESRSIIIERPDYGFGWAIAEKTKFIAQWGIFPYQEFPKNYFKFHDTTAYEYYVLPK